jgi:phosphoribosyl 1,2-cyclic phosphodiesterase
LTELTGIWVALAIPGCDGMHFSVLGSGSRGNAVYIESGKTAILIDAGFSGKEIESRLQAIGRELSAVRALCITHEHNDHIRGAGVISRRCRIPTFINGGTFAAGEQQIGKLFDHREFATGDLLQIGDLQVRSFPISHDTADPVGYVVSDGKTTIGYCTDTGRVSHLIGRRLESCNGLILEFNHNVQMLKNGPYPLPLQQRVRSSRGHLCNEDAAAFLAGLMGGHLRKVVLAHLSETNNTPQLAREAALLSVREWGDTSLHIACQAQPTSLLSL